MQISPQLFFYAKNRLATGRGAKYWKDFSKPKVLWKIIGSNINFCYDENQRIKGRTLDSTLLYL